MASQKYMLAEELLAIGGCLERENVFFMDAAPREASSAPGDIPPASTYWKH